MTSELRQYLKTEVDKARRKIIAGGSPRISETDGVPNPYGTFAAGGKLRKKAYNGRRNG